MFGSAVVQIAAHRFVPETTTGINWRVSVEGFQIKRFKDRGSRIKEL
ncbi:MAG: hypothetical protein AB1567_06000 [bacterium]